ncbi:MAG: hypothetical protein FT671_01495 [Pantoea sp. Brub]|nr:hypothetical protein [Pantoea sp. Brub]
MLDLSVSKLMIVFIVALIVIGPQKLPIVIKTVAYWTKTFCSLLFNLQNDIQKEIKLEEFSNSLKQLNNNILEDKLIDIKTKKEINKY